MRIRKAALSACLTVILGGCSLLEEANDTVSYARDASEYVDKAAAFVEEVPAELEKAVNDEQAREELKTKLEEMKTEITEFGNLEAPEIASGLHEEIKDKNAVIQEKIDVYLTHIENGTLDEELAKSEDLKQPLEEIQAIYEQIKELGK